MTQILTCLSRQHVVQVADRRLTNLATGTPVDDDACKAIVVAGRAIVGYTGLANLGPPQPGQMDLWLVDQLQPEEIEKMIGRLRDNATARFGRLSRLSRAARRHSFVIAGWRGDGAHAQPYCATVTNAENVDGSWKESADPEFRIAEHSLGSDNVLLRVSGQPLPRDQRRALVRALNRSARQEAAGDQFVANLVDALRAVADSNPYVGRAALATVLPREAIGTEGFLMRGGFSVGAGGSPATRAYYFPARPSPGTLYMPHYVSSGMRMSDVQVHNRALTPEEIKARYEAGLRRRQ